MSCKLKGLVLSDVHLFHDKAKTSHVVDGLLKAFPMNSRFKDFDIFFISGDLFDRAVFLPNADVYEAMKFCHHLLNFCVQHDIVLRVLEGTPSHDWKQSRMLIELNEQREVKADVKHITNLSIEYIERFDINVLYVPDEWGSGCDPTLLEVKDLLRQHGLKQVDFSIMHGCFGYQFPESLAGKVDTHSETAYLEITKHLIFIGHYHTPSVFERIHVPGSFDRLKHNEEEDKGHLEFYIYDDDTHKVIFRVNENATVFKTFDCRGKEVKEITGFLDAYSETLDKLVYIKLIANRDEPIFKGIQELRDRYPRIHFSIESKEKKKSDEKLSNTEDIIRPQTLDMETITKLMKARLDVKHPDMSEQLLELFTSVVKND